MSLDKAGLLKTTLLDFPGEVASVIFTPGCNLRCPYCHNPGLVDLSRADSDLVPMKEIHSFLKARAHLIGGVAITGGEPLLHEDLPELIEFIRSLGLKVKVDTNGLFPERLKKLDVQYIAMDLKTRPDNYKSLGLKDDWNKLIKSIEYIIESGINHEFRTTVTEEFVTEEDMKEMIPLLHGAKKWYLTAFRSGKTLDPVYKDKESPTKAYMEKLLSLARSGGIETSIR